MTHCAIAHLTEARFGPEIRGYLDGIDETLAPFGGKFLVHGDSVSIREGAFSGDVVIIAFPDQASAEGWYSSEEYARILPLRREHSEGWVILVAGGDDAHKATDILRS